MKRDQIKKVQSFLFSKYTPKRLREYGVYAIKNTRTNQYYIGSTGETFKHRWSNHIRELAKGSHQNYLLQESWDKFGFTNFEFLVLEITDNLTRKEIYDLEQRYIHDFTEMEAKLFNIDLNIMIYEYLSRFAKDAFPTLIEKTFGYNPFEYDMSVGEIEKLAEYIENITLCEYGEIISFLHKNCGKRKFLHWNDRHEDFNLSMCNIEKCPYYDKDNRYCKFYQESLIELYILPCMRRDLEKDEEYDD